MKKVLAILISVVMIIMLIPTALADDTSSPPTDTPQITETQQATVTPQQTLTTESTERPEPTATPEPTHEPTATPELTPKPTVTPDSTPEPAATPELTPKPIVTPEPIMEPTVTPEPTEKVQAMGNIQAMDETSGDYTYTVNNGGTTCTITGYTGSDGDITIPDTIDGKTVTEIGNGSFCEHGTYVLCSVIMPDTIIGIGVLSFENCIKMESIKLSNRLINIGEQAFSNCYSLKNIIIPNSVTNIGDDAFNGCNCIYSLTLPSELKSIGEGALRDCSGLTEIYINENNSNYKSVDGVLFNKEGTTIIQYPAGNQRTDYTVPNGVEAIGVHAFERCDNLKTVVLPDGLTRILNYAFNFCTGLSSVNIPYGVTSLGYESFCLCTELESITIPDSVVKIGEEAFDQCHKLANVVLNENLKSIGDNAFNGCRDLGSIKIPSSVTSIGDAAFANCYYLLEINVEKGNLYYKSIDGVLFNYSGTHLIQYPPFASRETYSIPDSVTEISNSAFNICQRLKNITIPKSVTDIEEHAFFQCGIESITIPSNVDKMVGYAFYSCDGLKTINVDAKNDYFKSINGVLFDISGTKLLQYPHGNSSPNYIIPDGVTGISFYSFYSFNGQRNLKNLYIPKSVTNINPSTFNYYVFSPGDITIYGDSDSTAKSFADSKGIKFEAEKITPVSGVSLDHNTLLMWPGETVTLNATVSPEMALVKDVIWQSDNWNIAEVQNGTVTAHRYTGNVKITVTTLDGGFTDTCEVRVEPQLCTVTFINSTLTPIKVPLGTSISEPYEPVDLTKCFCGWYPTPEYDTEPISFPFTPKEDTYLYAKWLPNNHTVIFNMNNGSGVDNKTVNYGELIPQPDDPRKTGYGFCGWYTDNNTYNRKWQFTFDTMPDNDLTLYAKWDIDTYTITYYLLGGTVAPFSNPIIYTIGTPIVVLINPKKTGYIFKGWTSPDNSTPNINTKIGIGTYGDKIFTANWAACISTVTLNASGGNVSTPSIKVTYDNSYGGLPTPKRSGYCFCGWYTGANGTGSLVKNTDTVKITNDITLYAKWVKGSKVTLSKPALAVKAAGYNAIALSWKAVKNAQGYEIYRSAGNAKKFSLLTTISDGSLSYADTAITTGTKYYYKIRAYCVPSVITVYGGYSSSKYANTVPSSPSGLTLTPSGPVITVSWNAADGATGYEIYRATSAKGKYKKIVTTADLSINDTKIAAGKTYYYKIRSYCMAGKTKIYGGYTSVSSLKI